MDLRSSFPLFHCVTLLCHEKALEAGEIISPTLPAMVKVPALPQDDVKWVQQDSIQDSTGL